MGQPSQVAQMRPVGGQGGVAASGRGTARPRAARTASGQYGIQARQGAASTYATEYKIPENSDSIARRLEEKSSPSGSGLRREPATFPTDVTYGNPAGKVTKATAGGR